MKIIHEHIESITELVAYHGTEVPTLFYHKSSSQTFQASVEPVATNPTSKYLMLLNVVTVEAQEAFSLSVTIHANTLTDLKKCVRHTLNTAEILFTNNNSLTQGKE